MAILFVQFLFCFVYFMRVVNIPEWQINVVAERRRKMNIDGKKPSELQLKVKCLKSTFPYQHNTQCMTTDDG